MRFYDGNLSYLFTDVPPLTQSPWGGLLQAGTNRVFDDEWLIGRAEEAIEMGRELFLDVEDANLRAKYNLSGDEQYKPPVPGEDGATEKDRQDHVEHWQIDRAKVVREAVGRDLQLGVYVSVNEIKKELPDTSRQERQGQLVAPDGNGIGLFALVDFVLYGGYYVNPAGNIDGWVKNVLVEWPRALMAAAWRVRVVYGADPYYWSKYQDGNRPVEREKIDAQLDAAEALGCSGVAWVHFRTPRQPFSMSDPYVQATVDRMRASAEATTTLRVERDEPLTFVTDKHVRVTVSGGKQ